MSQTSHFGFDEDAVMLRDSARRLLSEALPTEALHQQVAANSDVNAGVQVHWDKGLWQQMQELGWHLLVIPEALGGVDMPLAAVAGLMEEVGRAALPSPLYATTSCCYVLKACDDSAQDALKTIAEGASATLGLADAKGSWNVADTGLSVRDGKLYGTAYFVQDAAKVDYFLLCAKTSDNVAQWFWVDAKADGVRMESDVIVDRTRDQARIHCDGADAKCVGSNAAEAIASAWPALWILLAADMVGAGEWQLQTTAEYARTRQQFDRTLGFFQAVKHPLVNVMCDIDQAKSLVYAAANAYDSGLPRTYELAHMAKSSASDMAGFASSRSVQYHGGIGFTWECFVHLYFKRQKHSQALFGDGLWHRRQLAEQVFAREA